MEKNFNNSDPKSQNENEKANIQDLAKEFALRTTSHGISRIAEANTKFKRTAWIVIVAASFIGYGVHVGILVSRFLQYDVSIKMEVVTGDSVLFPAVTVCNSNKLRLSEVKNSPYSDLAIVNERSFSFTYRGPCVPGDRACDEDNKICIKRYMWCNGIVDCDSGIDETDCNSGNCLPDQYKCDNSKCLPFELKCNFRDDCGDNSDELHHAMCVIRDCKDGEFQCEQTRQCLPLHVICNGRHDCVDGTDELSKDTCDFYSAGLCYYDVSNGMHICEDLGYSYQCPGGFRHMRCGGTESKTCLLESKMCDGKVDCQYGEDEVPVLCSSYYFKCPYGKFKCDSGQCILDDRVCDGVEDCADGKDETICQEGHNQNPIWRCGDVDQQYIPEDLRCNGYLNCENAADEQGCEHYQCPVGMMKCLQSNLCVDNSKMCDGSYDCAYSSEFDLTDEENCLHVGCAPEAEKYKCDNGQCINRDKRCDLHPDCLDKSDEHNCTKEDCPHGTFLCSWQLADEDNQKFYCLDDTHWCDERGDCHGFKDESACRDYTCLESQFQCGLRCKLMEKRCDDNFDCPLEMDEVNCENHRCPEGYFRCRNGQCIRQYLYCDEPTKPECTDGSDEIFCDATCKDNELQCTSGWCVNAFLVCDGVDDCGDGSDELNCTLCNSSQYACQSGFEEGNRIVVKCIPDDRQCDRFTDCHFGDDEYDCEYAVRDITSEKGWNTKYLEISDDQDVYEDFREHFFVNRPTDFIPKEYPPLWDHFLVSSNTPDFSDLRNVLRLSQEEVRRMGHQGHDLIVQCTYDQQECSVTDFHQFQNDVYGNCYTFNHGKNGSVLRKASNTGSEFGLKLTLYTEQDEYVSIFGQEAGVRIVVHDQHTTPFPEDEGIDAKTGTATSVIIKKRQEHRMDKPHGNCTNQTHVDSGAFFYSISACQRDCLYRETFKKCGCVPVSYLSKPYCDVLNKTQDACVQLINFFYQNAKLQCDCRQRCSITEYTKMMSLTSWPSSSYSPRLISSLLAVNPKIRSIMTSDDAISKNLARVKIYYESLNLERISEVKDYPDSQLMADVGGALGLWIGLSIITVVEFLEFLLDVISKGTTKKERKTGYSNPQNQTSTL
ncbi:uncharacterized protein [Ptychodera flava]|uniref:uncharacterized protein n=1 Tax=Ptychodera flava TaxID=63121 RepID=UPI00396A8C8C